MVQDPDHLLRVNQVNYKRIPRPGPAGSRLVPAQVRGSAASADVEAATRYWARVTGAALDQFVRPVIKHHTPRRPRPSGNADYHGCLRVSVIKSSTLYCEISGWAHGVMTARRRDPV